MDILPPPKQPLSSGRSSQVRPPEPMTPKPATPITPPPVGSSKKPPQPTFLRVPWYRKWHLWVLLALGIFVLLAGSLTAWYVLALQPKSTTEQKIQLVVSEGESSAAIIDKIGDSGLVRSKLATRLYVELSGTKSKLQAGGYILSPSQSVSEIIDHIVAGKTDEQLVTIPPGRTLKELREDLKRFGYSDTDIDAAFGAQYNSPLLADKPSGVTLEGYIYPESFKVVAGEPLSKLFERSFDELYSKLQADGVIDKFKGHGLNLHQGLTLASIVQKEVSDPVTQKQVAQVFYSRLAIGMVLGSDVTFEYAAAQLGVTPAVNIDSPYNTRQNPGLPPGPIANMNYAAIQAVADPATGDYLYFVAGDDGQTYFARTDEEHQANVAAHCHELCNLY